mgnify:CR=1 FL=1
MISAQCYFLIGHELGHLFIGMSKSREVPDDYKRFVDICMKVLADRIKNKYLLEDFIEMRSSYFI